MPRRSRKDIPGSWHHVFNRSIARRTLFERREDYRFFLACLARAVRRGEIEVHAYCLMGTHYHLLIRSVDGRIAKAMHRIQLAYSRWFNRSRQRDGSLVRGRFGSKPVQSHRYRVVLVRYIDFNPCSAGFVDHASMYPWGSASQYAKEKGPPWLERSWVESEIVRASEVAEFRPRDYDLAFPGRNGAELSQFVEARLASRGDEDAFDDIVGAASSEVQAWMTRKAMLADGTRPGLPVLPLLRLDRLLDEMDDEWVVERGGSKCQGRLVARVGLGRDLCGATLSRLANDMGVSITKIRRIYAMHRAGLEDDHAYTTEVVNLVRRGLDGWETV